MQVHGFSDEKHSKREKEKARSLRKSSWWKQKIKKGECYYCQKSFTVEALTMDHKIPVSRGGQSTKGNVVVCCKDCNSAKKYYTPVEMILKEQDAQALNTVEL